MILPEALDDLQKKTQRRESKQLSLWSNMKTNLTKEPSKQPETWLKHHHHPVRVGVSQLLTHLFKVENISFSYW